jgi:CrcB protein
MYSLFPVMVGGAIGAALRFLFSAALPARLGWPWGTLTVNLAGGFAMGLLAAFVMRGQASESVGGRLRARVRRRIDHCARHWF